MTNAIDASHRTGDNPGTAIAAGGNANLDQYRMPDAPKSAADKPAATAPDKTSTDTAASLTKSMDVMHKVDSILDNDVPKLNQAHDLGRAKDAYQRAITMANTLTPADIDTAKHKLADVRKQEKVETDPTKKRELAQEDADLFTITRLKDAAAGNMALWYYRQGDKLDGNQKLLEACGISEADAKSMNKMEAADINKLTAFLTGPGAGALPPILGDVNFNRQLSKINDTTGGVPEIFGQLYQSIHAAQVSDRAAANTDNNTSDNTAPRGDGSADRPGVNSPQSGGLDVAATKAAMDNFQKAADAIAANKGAITPEQKQAIEAGVKAYDANNSEISNALSTSQAALDKLVPADKQAAFAEAYASVQSEMQKTLSANNNTIPADLQTQVTAFAMGASAEDRAKAGSALAQSNPNIYKALVEARKVVPDSSPDSAKIATALFQNADLQQEYIASSTKQAAAHVFAAKLLAEAPGATANDTAEAAQIFKSGFANVPKSIRDDMLSSSEVGQLAVKLKLTDGTTPTSADAGTAGQPTDNSKPAGPDVSDNALNAAGAKGKAGLAEVKAIFEARAKLMEDPQVTSAAAADAKANLAALASGKDAQGNVLDSKARLALHQKNIDDVNILSAAANNRVDYASYLKSSGIDQFKSMDDQMKLARAAADSVDPKILKGVDDAINADRKTMASDSDAMAVLNKAKIQMEGGKLTNGDVDPGFMDLRINLRNQQAYAYLTEAAGKTGDNVSTPAADQATLMYRPKEALQLLTEARAANTQLHGAGTTNTTTENLYGAAAALDPAHIKAQGDHLSSQGGSAVASAVALIGTVAMDAVLARFHLPEVNPGVTKALVTGATVATGIGVHRLAYNVATGHSESWQDSIVAGSAAGLVPLGFRSFKNSMVNQGVVARTMAGRQGLFTTEAALARTGQELGEGSTFSQAARAFDRAKLGNISRSLGQLGDKPIASASAEDLAKLDKQLNLNGFRGAEAIERTSALAKQVGEEDRLLSSLSKRGINTPAELAADLKARAARVGEINQSITAGGATLDKKTTMLDALRTVKGADGKALYASEDALKNEAQFLRENNINTIGDLQKVAANTDKYFSLKSVAPRLAKLAPDADIQAVNKTEAVLGKLSDRNKQRLIAMLPEANVAAPVSKTYLESAKALPAAGVGKVRDLLWSDRFYSPSGRTVLDPLTASPAKIAAANASTRFLAGTAGYAGVISGYNAFNSEYDNWYKGKNVQDADGSIHRYTFVEALEDGALSGKHNEALPQRLLSTATDDIFAGYLFRGMALESLQNTPVRFWLSGKIPGANAALDAISPVVRSLGPYVGLAAYGPGLQGNADLATGNQLKAQARVGDAPLVDE